MTLQNEIITLLNIIRTVHTPVISKLYDYPKTFYIINGRNITGYEVDKCFLRVRLPDGYSKANHKTLFEYLLKYLLISFRYEMDVDEKYVVYQYKPIGTNVNILNNVITREELLKAPRTLNEAGTIINFNNSA